MGDIFISPAEALNTIMRRIYPQHLGSPPAISSYEFFRDAQRAIYAGDGLMREMAPPIRYGRLALDLLKKNIRQSRIALQGCSDTRTPPGLINSADCSSGDLHIFDATLEIHIKGIRQYCWWRIGCRVADVEKVIDPRPRTTRAKSKGEAARLGVLALYPNCVPDDVSNAMLCRKVGEWLKVNYADLGDISDDTIERAAGRK
jgi:hypothetical protein